ncbi:unnamed protein product [Clonostachys rosea f. rosea IK726]|uniref:Uncharacterized protein n=1 Tax=Clonostachys rosea f. rosea IK726 TaxID=1349383 RepID=A0ACA9TVB4_BIOOC|nr:unnamed protein product [Clonostachys rosea f. rosea IK726]
MAPLRTFLLPALMVAAVRAANISDYVPSCAPSCINEAVADHSTCEQSDGACLCRDIYSLKRHSEKCLKSGCSDADYGSAMLGFDNFCKDSSAPAPSTTGGSAPTSASSSDAAPTSASSGPSSSGSPSPSSSGSSGDVSSTAASSTDGSAAPTTASSSSSGGSSSTASTLITSSATTGGGGGNGESTSTGSSPSSTSSTPPSAGSQLQFSAGLLAGGAILAGFLAL